MQRAVLLAALLVLFACAAGNCYAQAPAPGM
jgi:hypothetical protein